MFGESVRRLVDADHPGFGKLFRQNGRAHAGATKGVEHDGSHVLGDNVQKLLERLRMLRAGFLPAVLLVMLDDINQIGMGCHLIGSQHWS